jgi:hypothetical protein
MSIDNKGVGNRLINILAWGGFTGVFGLGIIK